MKNIKYLIPEISALSIISTARKTDDGYDFCFDSTSIPNEYRTENTLQDDCPIFHQAMCILYGEDFRNSELLCEALRDVFVYVDFSGIFNRMPVGRILELQELAKEMFKPKGIRLNFGKEDMTYIAFERSASMSRDNRLSFVRSDIYEALKDRMMLGMTIGKCQLSKLYAYNALLFTSGKRYCEEDILSEKRIIVIDNPESVIKDVDITKLKQFRTWLANEILLLNSSIDGEYNTDLTSNQIHMLEFYQNDMYNEVIKQLSIFGVDNSFTALGNNSNCGCCSPNSNLLNITLPTTCRPIEIYTKNLHNLMVKTFEDTTFWMKFNVEFLKLFKLYIDNIIKAGFVITTNDIDKMYVKCDCQSSNNHTAILQNLSTALEYMIDNNVANHRNFIHDALYKWAENLYDYMYWK